MAAGGGGKQARRTTAAEAAALVRPGDWLDYGTSFNQPDAVDRALAARAGELSGVGIRNCLTVRPRAVLEQDPEGRAFHAFNWHFSGYDRRMHDAGRVTYIPCNLGEIPHYYRRNIERVDIAILKATAPDADGYLCLGPNSLWHGAVMERAKTLVVEVSTQVPRAFGTDNRIHLSEIDALVEGEDGPTPELPSAPVGDVDRAVAAQIAERIDDGACLQIGIGGMPNAVCALLLEAGIKDLGIHTEMMNDGLAALYRAGLVKGAGKAVEPGRVSYTFALGTRMLYETIAGNADFICLPVDITNDPAVIARNERVVAINNTTQIDLQGQAASESDGHRHISGTGGQLQFVRGAYASAGGKSFICLASTYERKGIRKSRIVLEHTPGNIVTTPRSDMMFVVTEFGCVNLKGMSVAERARALIGLAHPDFREELSREARAKGLVPRFFV